MYNSSEQSRAEQSRAEQSVLQLLPFALCFLIGEALFIGTGAMHTLIGWWHHWKEPFFDLLLLMSMAILWRNFAEKFSRVFAIAIKCVFTFFVVLYFVQCYYFAVANEFITTLALENLDQIYLLLTPKILFLILIVITISLLICRQLGKSKVKLSKPMIVFLVSLCLVSTFFSIAQNQLLPSTYYHTGIFRKLQNMGDSPFLGFFLHAGRASGIFEDKYNEKAAYAFEKDTVYDAPELELSSNGLAYPHPNVIVILTEGTSARLLGCYGGKFDGLTPNFDDFARHAMQVENYFNHTAATFRGTHGQFASCYPKRGGQNWKKGISSHPVYQTLPKVLATYGYETYFISPHAEMDPYTDLVKMLGFDKVYTRDTAQDLLGMTPDTAHESIRDHDMYRELRSLLENHTSDAPLFASMYTFETHTQVDTDEKECSYGDGSNMTLNTLHNVDDAFGRFWQWFQQSPYRDNTILVVTADHAHYNDSSFLALVGKDADYHSCFYDRIPLLIYDPIHELPHRYDADDQTSLNLTPTILHLLGIRDVKNSFMGKSIFEDQKNEDRFSVAASRFEYFGIYHHEVHKDRDVDANYREKFEAMKDEISLFYAGENINAVYRP